MSGEGKDTTMTRISKTAKARLLEMQQEIYDETGFRVDAVQILDRLVLAGRKPDQP